MEMTFRTATKAEQMYCYTQSMQIMAQTGCIGHLRADMGSDGLEFYPTWEDHYVRLKDQAFKNEINQVIHALRVEEEYGCMLQNRVSLNRYCWSHIDAQMGQFSSDFAFRADTEKFSYLLRLNTNRGEYNLYCYCYVKGWLDDHLQKAEQGIRFIDPRYHNLFRLQDGGKIRIHHRDGTHMDFHCRYVDSTHVEVGNNLYHICELAERMEQSGAKIEPLEGRMPERSQKDRGEAR